MIAAVGPCGWAVIAGYVPIWSNNRSSDTYIVIVVVGSRKRCGQGALHLARRRIESVRCALGILERTVVGVHDAAKGASTN